MDEIDDLIDADWLDEGVQDDIRGVWQGAGEIEVEQEPIWVEDSADEMSAAPRPAPDPDPFFDQPVGEETIEAGTAEHFETPPYEVEPDGFTAYAEEQGEAEAESAEPMSDQQDATPDPGASFEGLTILASGIGNQIDDLNAALLEMAFQPVEQPAEADVDGAGLEVLDESVESELAREMFETFALECADYLNAISRAAMQLDRDPTDPEPLREVRRVLHTLKGAAAAADVEDISAKSHELEDVLAALDAAGSRVDREFVSALFAGIDEMERALGHRRRELRGEDPDAGAHAEPEATLRVDLGRIDDLLNTVGELVVSRAGLEQRLERLAATLDELSLAASRLQRSSYLLERETHSEDAIGRLIRGEFSRSGSMVTIGRMEQSEWDELEMERYTEFDRLIRQLAEVGADVGTAVAEIQGVRGDLDTISNRQRRLTNVLQDELMGIRMVPIASAAPALYRVVRRVAGRRDKQVNLVFEGGETPFDKMLLDALNEPLLHLLRNAVDHGIESTEERRRLGKPETGTIKIRAHHEGNEAIIDVVDDGAGIDHELVIASARQRGLDVPDGISRQDALRYIFLPGFSTRQTADDVSGRGVGLEIVERAIKRVKGRLSVDSLPGRGTMFSLRLPLQLSVTQAFLVEAGGGRFAIPIANIEYVAERVDQPLSEFGETVVVDVNGSAIPVVDVAERFGQATTVLEREEGWVMIAEVGGERWALVVDALEGQQEIVVKPLGRFLRDQPSLMGATILGNGEVALILDVPQVLGGAPGTVLEPAFDVEVPDGEDPGPETGRDRGPLVALVVDDSLSVRRVVGRTLERYGWAPVLARDGVEGIEALESGGIDVVITDIEMPRMDGFELLTAIRGNAELADVPVIVLTSRSGEKHRGRAFELGANAYLVKPFQEQELIEMVNRTARAVPVAAQP